MRNQLRVVSTLALVARCAAIARPAFAGPLQAFAIGRHQPDVPLTDTPTPLAKLPKGNTNNLGVAAGGSHALIFETLRPDAAQPLAGIGQSSPKKTWTCAQYASALGDVCDVASVQATQACSSWKHCQDHPWYLLEKCPTTCAALEQPVNGLQASLAMEAWAHGYNLYGQLGVGSGASLPPGTSRHRPSPLTLRQKLVSFIGRMRVPACCCCCCARASSLRARQRGSLDTWVVLPARALSRHHPRHFPCSARRVPRAEAASSAPGKQW